MVKDSVSINDRIIQFVEYLDIDMDLFAYLCNVKSEVIFNDKLNEDDGTLNKIFEVYPELNPKWVKTGDGSMLGSPLLSPFNEDDIDLSTDELLRRRLSNSKLLEGIKERLAIYQGYINAMPSKLEKSFFGEILYKSTDTAIDLICRNYTNLNPKWLVYGEGDMVYDWSQFGDSIGATLTRWGGKEKLSESSKMTAEWALKSFAFRWVESCVKRGMATRDIFEIFNCVHKENPALMKSRSGTELTYEVFKTWLCISTKLIPKYISEFLSK